MNFYRIGKGLLDKEQPEKARESFSQGILAGDVKCLYGAFACSMIAKEAATEERENLLSAIPKTRLLFSMQSILAVLTLYLFQDF